VLKAPNFFTTLAPNDALLDSKFAISEILQGNSLKLAFLKFWKFSNSENVQKCNVCVVCTVWYFFLPIPWGREFA